MTIIGDAANILSLADAAVYIVIASVSALGGSWYTASRPAGAGSQMDELERILARWRRLLERLQPHQIAQLEARTRPGIVEVMLRRVSFLEDAHFSATRKLGNATLWERFRPGDSPLLKQVNEVKELIRIADDDFARTTGVILNELLENMALEAQQMAQNGQYVAPPDPREDLPPSIQGQPLPRDAARNMDFAQLVRFTTAYITPLVRRARERRRQNAARALGAHAHV
ncbi:hypothetical protein C8Q73DRAFT_696978 [Cubamyces lactineus]|nr:hypothetical protein C8Q73DRAFT_696978 [Cubamyces lactineus]